MGRASKLRRIQNQRNRFTPKDFNNFNALGQYFKKPEWQSIPDTEQGPVVMNAHKSAPSTPQTTTLIREPDKKMFSLSASRLFKTLSPANRSQKVMGHSQFRTFTNTMMRGLNPTRYIPGKRNRGPLLGLMFLALLCAGGYYGYNYLNGRHTSSFRSDRALYSNYSGQTQSTYKPASRVSNSSVAKNSMKSSKYSKSKYAPKYTAKNSGKKSSKYTQSRSSSGRYSKASARTSGKKVVYAKRQLKKGVKKNYHKSLAKK